MRRPAGLRMRISARSPTTRSPAVRLEMISPLSRSEASALAAVARSWAFSFETASCSAGDSTSISPPSFERRRVSRAAAMKRSKAKTTTETRAATIAVRPSSAYAFEERGIWNGASPLSQIPGEQAWADGRGGRRAKREERAERQGGLQAAPSGDDEKHADDRTDERPHHQRHQRELPYEERSDHGQHLEVAHPETLFMPQPEVGVADGEERSPADQYPDQRRPPSGLGEQAEQEADNDARQRDRMRQELMLAIDLEQHDQGTAQNQPRRQQHSRP